MNYLAFATDYDGTLAEHGQVDAATLATLEDLRRSGRRLILVSGREHDDLLRVFPHLHLFDRVVLENGALLIRPAERLATALADPPTKALLDALRERGVSPLSSGEVIISSWQPNEMVILDAIRELGLEHQVIFNKGAVMVLPPGINKASGLQAALSDLKLSPHNVVGIGDAENDVAFLQVCGCAVAVANALPSIQERADVVTVAARGAGVRELAERLRANDLIDVPVPPRHRIVLGEEGRQVVLPVRGGMTLIAGTSGAGKSTFVQAVLERLVEQQYQYCVVDPEGDYDQLADTLVLGRRDQVPKITQVTEVLEEPKVNVTVNMLGIALAERPIFFAKLLSALGELHLRTGRPHYIVVDEAHHMIPDQVPDHGLDLSRQPSGLMLVTVHPDQISPAALSKVDLAIALGQSPQQTIEVFCQHAGEHVPPPPAQVPTAKDAVIWRRGPDPLICIPRPEPRGERRRHIRKYAEGKLGEDKSFYFRGPDDRLNLRAQNLSMFLQMAEGVDDETWLHHLRLGDYSRWLREAIKDEELALEAEEAATVAAGDAGASRERIRAAIERRYTGPASQD